MLKEQLDTLIREYLMCQTTASKQIYIEAKLLWKHIEDIFLKTVQQNLDVNAPNQRHIIEIGHCDTKIMYSTGSYYMHSLTNNTGYSHEIIEMLLEIAKLEGILVVKKPHPEQRTLWIDYGDTVPVRVEIYEFIYQPFSEQ